MIFEMKINNLMNVNCIAILSGLKSEAHLEPCQISKMEIFAKIINGFQLYTPSHKNVCKIKIKLH